MHKIHNLKILVDPGTLGPHVYDNNLPELSDDCYIKIGARLDFPICYSPA